jgi:hypothetical protein
MVFLFSTKSFHFVTKYMCLSLYCFTYLVSWLVVVNLGVQIYFSVNTYGKTISSFRGRGRHRQLITATTYSFIYINNNNNIQRRRYFGTFDIKFSF